VELDVHPMLLYRLVDPVRVAYETYDLTHAVEKLVQTTLRSIIGEMSLDDTLSSREEIERSMKVKIAKICFDWGLEIRSVELLEITPSYVVQEAMHKQLSAERIRRAAIVSADGQREKTKLEAEGDCQASIALAIGERQVAIVKAQGLADARRLIAKAEADSVRIIAGALQEFGVEPTQVRAPFPTHPLPSCFYCGVLAGCAAALQTSLGFSSSRSCSTSSATSTLRACRR